MTMIAVGKPGSMYGVLHETFDSPHESSSIPGLGYPYTSMSKRQGAPVIGSIFFSFQCLVKIVYSVESELRPGGKSPYPHVFL
jgi:hypothetical protein